MSSSKSGCCAKKPNVSRRGFLKYSANAAVVATFGDLTLNPKMVFANNSKTATIPLEKKLSTNWLNSLSVRTEPEIYNGWHEQLQYIGMPIGGMGCGQLYLGGDGQLWHWDIFKSNYGIDPEYGESMKHMATGDHYSSPIAQGEQYTNRNGADITQGFAIEIEQNGIKKSRYLNRKGFPNVSFRGEYPIGKVAYHDDSLPVDIDLEAFSPFVPLNEKDSSLPATVMSFKVTNRSKDATNIKLMGWLQNAVCPYSKDNKIGTRQTTVKALTTGTSLFYELLSEKSQGELRNIHGYGSLALSIINTDERSTISAIPTLKSVNELSALFAQPTSDVNQIQRKIDQNLIGGLQNEITLAPGESQTIEFVISWYFPDYALYDKFTEYHFYGPDDFAKARRHYSTQFSSALDVVTYIENNDHLLEQTRRWNRSWYDSTLPHWLLDRSFIAINCMATQVFHWFDNGRPYGWEGVDCCPGTCTHVWYYAQGLARIFPGLERLFRERVDFGVGYSESGRIQARGEIYFDRDAVDGHAGTILRVYREHQTSADNEFLTRLWPQVKRSVQYLMAQDTDESGLLRGHQYNTLDAAWYGPMGWISSLYIAAITASQQMALEMNDIKFADFCKTRADKGRENIVEELFNGEYFIHKPDPNYPNAIRSGIGCHIDQVLGQSWAHQINLERILPKSETLSALNSLWNYNFAPDAGQYAIDNVAIEQAYRVYAMPGEAGLVMCSWPNGGATEAIPDRKWFGLFSDTPNYRPKENPAHWTGPGAYFNECMNGFEYQVAWHMIAEGEPDDELVHKGLAITRAVHERYAAEKRNPYNEIECSDHYARSMASYGVFIAACGFTYHGPKGQIGFSPKITPNNFKACFTAAQGWGAFEQQIHRKGLTAQIDLHYGSLTINKINLTLAKGTIAKNALVNGKVVAITQSANDIELALNATLEITKNEQVEIEVLT